MGSMDIEREDRSRWIDILSQDFYCFEEINVRDAIFDQELRADIVCVPKKGCQFAIVIEVKKPTFKWELSDWIDVLRQSASYCFSEVDCPDCELLHKKRVLGTFVWPSPMSCLRQRPPQFMRDYDPPEVRGAFLLAQHLGVGGCFEQNGKFGLELGTEKLWNSHEGFKPAFQRRLEGGFRRGNKQNSRISLDRLREI